jgi:hypothetical protein
MKKITLLLLIMLSNICFSQEVNPRWLGEWIGYSWGNQEILKINKSIFQHGTSRCRIVKKVNNDKSQDCIIVYGDQHKISKKEITAMYNMGLVEVELRKDNKIIKDYQAKKIILDVISDDTFRFLMPTSELALIEGSEDAQTYGFILDKENVYKIEFYPYGNTFEITQFKKK